MNVEFSWDEKQFYNMVASTVHNPTLPFIQKYLPKTEPVLEAGCGLGHIVKYLGDLGYDAYGIEIGSEAVKAVKQIEPNLRVECASVEYVPFPDNFFGGLICLGVVEHITQGPEKALKELYRVMKPGSIGVISVPVFGTLRKIKHYLGISYLDYHLRNFYHKLFRNGENWTQTGIDKTMLLPYHRWPYAGDFFEYRYTRKQFASKLTRAGFQIESEHSLEGMQGLYHELGGMFVNLSNPNWFVKMLDKIFSKFDFFHHHTYLAIVKKPL
jgi:SAM-dependent methyltransferase